MPDNKKGFTFDDFVNMGAQSQGSQFGQFGGATPTAPIEQFVMPKQEAPIVKDINQPDIKGAYDSVFSEQAQRNYIEESAKPKAPETVNYAEQAFGLGGSLNFNDTGAKREVLRFIGAKPDAQSVNYQVNREATQKARSGGDPNAIIYDFNVEDAKGNEYEIKGVSANALSELFARLRKPEEGKEAVLTDSPRRVRRKGEDWRLDIESPLEEGLVSIEKTSDFERDLSEFGYRALAGVRGASADLTISALQGATRAASYIAMPNQKMGLQILADSEIFSDAKQRAQDLVEQKGFENPLLAAGASGVGSVATIAPLGAAGLVGAAAGSFESGVQKSRELSARNGEPQSDMRDVAMGLGYGAAEFLAERVGLQSIKRAINPTAARKIGEKMINEAITSNPNILPRLFQAAKGTGTAAAVNYAEEFATNLGQEGINDLFYEVDRDLWQTLQDANMAGIGGAFGGGVASVTGQIGQSAAGALDRSNRGNLVQAEGRDASVISDQENYAITRLQRLGFTEQDALEEVIANRTGQKANTESRKQILQEFPESQAAVDGLLNKAKKAYGDSAAKVRNLFGSAREEMDASVDEQIAAAETILNPEPVVEPSVEELPVTEDAPIQEQQVEDLPITEEAPAIEQPAPVVDDFQEPSDLDLTDEELEALAMEDQEPVITEEPQAEEAPIENTETPAQEENFVPDETEDSTKAELLVDASAGISDEDFSRLEVKGTTKSGGVYYKPLKGRAFEIGKIKDGKLVATEANLKNKAKIPSYVATETTPNSQEGSQPGKRRRTRAQRAKDALQASRQSFTDAIDSAIKDNMGASLVPGLSASKLLEIIRATGVKINHLAVKALDKYIDLEAQAVNEGRTTLAQAVANVKEYLSNGIAKGVSFVADTEIAELITATVNDIPKRAEREKQRAAGKAKYEENMSKAEKNKAIKEQKKKADTVVKNIVKKANKGEIKGHNEMTILESILKLDERLGVSKAYLRQSFNDAVAELRNPTTTNIGRATVVDARNYVKKYANALLESNKNDLIKNRLVTQILNSIDKINSYASVMQQLEVIKNIMTKANYANRLRDAQRELAKAVKARMSTPGLADLVKFMRVSIKISNVQDLETLEKLTELAKKISETRTPGASLIKEFFDLYSSLKMPVPDTKETKEKDGKGKEGHSTKEIDESREASIKAIERVLKLGGYNPLETLRAMLGEDIASKTYKAIEAIKKYKTDSVKDFNYIVTFFNNVADVYESSIKGTGVTFNEYLMQQFATKEGFDTTNTILRLQARAAEEEMLESNVDKVVDGVAKLFDYKNKTLAGKIVFGEWLGKNTKRTFQQTIDRLVNYSSDASIAIEKAIRLPLLSAFTKAELRSQRILHNISEQIAKSKLEKSTYIHFQVLGMTLDYLNGDQKSHSYDAFVQNAIDIRRKIQNGTKDKNSRNQRDAKEGLVWFDKNIGKISDDLKSIEGPVANKVKALDGKPVNKESDYVALIRTVLPSSLTLLFQNNFALNFSELGAEVRAVSMMYKGETPDERPFYWPRKAIGRIDAGRVNNESDIAVSVEDFDDYDQYAKKIETILNNGLDGAKFGQISSRTNPHSLARTQNENLVYSLNAFDVASSFFTRATADVYVTPELFKINKILGTESRKVFKGEGSTALRDAVILLSRSAYNVGYKKLSNPLLKSIDPLIGEASRQMLGSYFQLYKQAIPPVTSYLLSGEGDFVQRFIALKSVLGNKENLAILGDIAATRVTKAKEQLKKKYERIGEQTGLDFGVSRSNAVIDSFRELSAQQGGGNWVETLGDNIEKSKLGFIVRQSRVSSEYLPTADSYARLIIYAAEIERRSGMKFDEFMTRRKFTPADEKIVALADKQVNRVMGSSFSKERSAALTMNSNSEYENLWKKINYFMSNALAQNSTTFKDSLQAAILDPENRAEHAKRAGLITANAMVFSGVGIGISSLLAGVASGLGALALGEEDEEEEKDSFARSLTGTAAGWTKDVFFGNSGNFINMLVTWAINLTDYSVKKATQMSDEEKLALVMKAARQYEANRMNDKQLVEELKNIQEQARISERTLLYQGAKSYGKTAELRPFVNLSGPYKGFINTPLDVIDLVYKEVDTKEGVKEKDMLKLASNFSKQVPFVQTDLSKVLQLTLKELQKERKPDGKEQNRR